MKRDLKKAIANYKSKFGSETRSKAAFYPTDYWQIKDMSDNSFDLVTNALQAGFMIGYQAAQREARKSRRNNIHIA